MTNVTTKKGLQGTLKIEGGKAVLEVNGLQHLIAYIRDNKLKIKSDLFLNDGDMAFVKSEMSQFIKKVDNSKKRK